MTGSPHVGMVGLGLMGCSLTERLIAAGFRVTGLDVDLTKHAPFVDRGGMIAASLAELAQHCQRVLVAVYDTDQVEEVVEAGLLPACRPGADRIVLCASTCDPGRIEALAKRTG